MATLAEVLQMLTTLSPSDKKQLAVILSGESIEGADCSLEEYQTDNRFVNGRVCPCCGGMAVVRNGHRKGGTQRYYCKDCSKSFVIATNSVFSGTRKPFEVWKLFIHCIFDGCSVRESAERCGIHRNTAFIWRHKILDALQNMMNKVMLEGIVETDEKFMAISFKGNHKNSKSFTMPRKAHKRGHSTHKRGLSREKVCIPCAVDRNGSSVAKIANLGRAATKDIDRVLGGKIKQKSVMCTDMLNSYRGFATDHDLELIQLKGGRIKQGIYHIQHINSYHSELTTFLSPFKGVSTKYLNNYLVWHNFVNIAKETTSEKAQILLSFVASTVKRVTNRVLSDRPAIPVAG